MVEEWRLQSVQSPIELKHEDSNEYDHFDPLEFHGHWDDEGKAKIDNNGFTGNLNDHEIYDFTKPSVFVATLRFIDRKMPILVGGPLHEDHYVFEQLHFHWSEDDHSGCEHIFEGKA